MTRPILHCDNVSLLYQGDRIFRNLQLEIFQGGCTAIISEDHVLPSLVLEMIAGRIPVVDGMIHYHFCEKIKEEMQWQDPLFHCTQLIQLVSSKHHFRNLSHTTDFYYQQRYNSIDENDSPTVREYLDNILPNQGKQLLTIEEIIALLQMEQCLDENLIKLSNGETRRVMLAAAILSNPVILLLDHPWNGLDHQSRIIVNKLLHDLKKQGMTILAACRSGEVTDAFSGVYLADREKGILEMDPSQFKQLSASIPETTYFDPNKLKQLIAIGDELPAYDHIINMENVKVEYDHRIILDNISWTVVPGERWALTGPNGAGKSTLLSLITGDNPKAYSNNIYLFDRKRGSGETIWEIKSKIGYLSPELHQYFPSGCICAEAVESGYYDTMGLFRPSDPEKRARVIPWLEIFGIEAYADKRLGQLSYVDQRLALLARAMIKDPLLLILDEPCHGMEHSQVERFKKLIDAICSISPTTLIYVSHYEEEFPLAINRFIRLEKGKRVD